MLEETEWKLNLENMERQSVPPRRRRRRRRENMNFSLSL
jgi:hypothetical protein